MTSPSHPDINPNTGLPDLRDFTELGHALRDMTTDAASITLSDGMGELSNAIENVANALAQQQSGTQIGPKLVDLLNAVRKHRQLVVGLSPTWCALPEHTAYLSALNSFRLLVGQWLVERSITGDRQLVLDDFEMIGWRTMGEGLLMLDRHEQTRTLAIQEQSAEEADPSRLARAKKWWGQLRG